MPKGTDATLLLVCCKMARKVKIQFSILKIVKKE